MKLIDRLGVSDERLRLMARIDADAGVVATRGYVLIDDRHHAGHANARFSEMPAFYMDIASGGPEDLSPKYVFDIMSRPDCEHFIWISQRAAAAPLPRFLWIYAHEVQHLVQRLRDPLCARANNLIRAAYGRTDRTAKLPLEFPAEFDAELAARNAVRRLLGADALAAYLEEQSLDPVGHAYFRRFHELEAPWRGLRTETAAMLRARRDELRALQRELADEEYVFDIDVLCDSEPGAR